VGTTLDEWKLFQLWDPGISTLSADELNSRLQKTMTDKHIKKLVDVYTKARVERGAPVTSSELFSAIQTDQGYRIPAIRLAESCQSRDRSIYVYLFTWVSPLLNGALGACHGIDQGFLFGTYDDRFSGEGPLAHLLSRRIQDAWLAFAATGNPSCENLGTWPLYDDQRYTMMLGRECFVQKVPYDEERQAWNSIPEKTIGVF
jgi:para-nitrobenzyl esterase